MKYRNYLNSPKDLACIAEETKELQGNCCSGKNIKLIRRYPNINGNRKKKQKMALS